MTRDFISYWTAIVLILLGLAVVLNGCSGSETDPDVIETGFGNYVVEITLDDGTHCATSNQGGLSCDWGSR